MGKTKHCPYMEEQKCDECGKVVYFESNRLTEDKIKRGWKRKWSWREFRFRWICLLCQSISKKVLK